MSVTKAIDLESIRFAAPDLEVMREFLIEFGLLDAENMNDGVLRMRGYGNAPCIHETELGDAGFRSVTLRVASRDDLVALAEHDGVEIEADQGPGGGERISLTDPDGFRVNVIAGKARLDDSLIKAPELWNVSSDLLRPQPKRLAAGPAHVLRFGHVVLAVSDMTRTWEWWQSRFGLLTSDEVRAPNGDVAALFVRFDRGATPCDHHALNFAALPGVSPRFHHAAFEVIDLDDLMTGNVHLAARGRTHAWGVGRHILGSQVFDYWCDPFGHRVEHWTDGDFFDASVPANVTDIPTMLGHQWGPPAPADFGS